MVVVVVVGGGGGGGGVWGGGARSIWCIYCHVYWHLIDWLVGTYDCIVQFCSVPVFIVAGVFRYLVITVFGRTVFR